MTDAARRTFRDSFRPDDPGLSEAERERRGEAAYRAHMTRLSQRSAATRAARKAQLRAARRAARTAADLLADLPADGPV